MAEACRRLIKNWHHLLELSQKLEDTQDAASREAFLEAVANARRSPGSTSTYSASMIAAGHGRNQTPKTGELKGAHFLELQKGQNSKAGTALDKILFRIWYLCWNLTNSVTLRPDLPVFDTGFGEQRNRKPL